MLGLHVRPSVCVVVAERWIRRKNEIHIWKKKLKENHIWKKKTKRESHLKKKLEENHMWKDYLENTFAAIAFWTISERCSGYKYKFIAFFIFIIFVLFFILFCFVRVFLILRSIVVFFSLKVWEIVSVLFQLNLGKKYEGEVWSL